MCQRRWPKHCQSHAWPIAMHTSLYRHSHYDRPYDRTHTTRLPTDTQYPRLVAILPTTHALAKCSCITTIPLRFPNQASGPAFTILFKKVQFKSKLKSKLVSMVAGYWRCEIAPLLFRWPVLRVYSIWTRIQHFEHYASRPAG